VSRRILVVEDEPAIADTITYALRTEGFEVDWRTTGAEALEALEKQGAALVVLDVGLPDQNGFDVCRAIRRTSQVPIIFLTARSSEIDRIVGLEMGGDDYVPKPFSPRELSARVRAVLRRSGGEQPAPQTPETPSFEVDRPRMRVAYHGRPLQLSRYEFRILDVLLSRPGWVYTRDKLMELVWEAPDSSMDRTVDTHVKNIRSKLHAVRPDKDPIITHRGVGYSIEDPV
jgi:two-component system catabolic regulation response regulator CreB